MVLAQGKFLPTFSLHNWIFLGEIAFYLQNLGGLASTSPWGKSSSASQNNTSHGCGSRKFSSWQALQMVDMSMYPLKAGEFPIGKEWQGLIPSALEWCNLWLKGTSLESHDFQEETDLCSSKRCTFSGYSCYIIFGGVQRSHLLLHCIGFIPPKKNTWGYVGFRRLCRRHLCRLISYLSSLFRLHREWIWDHRT